MKRSTSGIITTHVGSLPRPNDLIPTLQAKDSGQEYDRESYQREVSKSVADVVKRQADIGVEADQLVVVREGDGILRRQKFGRRS